MTTQTSSWMDNRKVQAILVYVEWYRRKYDIKIGMSQGADDNMGEDGQAIEFLARVEFGKGEWLDLTEIKVRDKLYAHVVYCVMWQIDHGVVIDGWVQPTWEVQTHVQEVVRYVEDFRRHHGVDLKKPSRDFRVDDLAPEGQFILQELVPTTNYSGSWEWLVDETFATNLANYVRDVLRSRLDAYIDRKFACVAQ